MIKRVITFFSLVAISAAAHAGGESGEAREALKQKLNAMEQYRADFSQQVTDNEGTLVHEANGTLVMARPDKLRWETAAPDETLLIADGQAVWNVDTFVEQVTIMDQQAAVSDNPIILLTTSAPDVWDDFNITASANDGGYVISPVEKGGQVKTLTLVFDENILSSLAMTDAQLQTSKLVFSEIQTQFTPEPGLFVVDVPDTYVVDDQR